ncbi:MAG: hypothetical protein ACXVXP_03770 [Mycobacteriaceae bacterium]
MHYRLASREPWSARMSGTQPASRLMGATRAREQSAKETAMYNSHLIEALATARRTEMLAAAEQARLARQARETRAARPRTNAARRRTPTGWRIAVRAFLAQGEGDDG